MAADEEIQERLKKLEEFNALKERKIELRNDKHKGEALKFPYCFDHLKKEYEELLKAKETGDKKKIAEELGDLSNMCEFTFLALKSEEHLQIKQDLLKIMAKPPRMNYSITDLARRYSMHKLRSLSTWSGFFGELISGSEIKACLNELLAENKIQKSGSFYGVTAAHPCENYDGEAGCKIMAEQGWGVNSECPFFTLEDAKTCADFKPRGG